MITVDRNHFYFCSNGDAFVAISIILARPELAVYENLT
jgi:hypothetical protein